MQTIKRYVEVLSIDICIGVLGSGALASTMLRAQMKPVWWFLLPASVWAVYTADHLFDAWKVGANAVNPRHKFHHEHFNVLATLTVLTSVVCGIAALLYLTEMVLIGGIMVGALAVLHVCLAFWGKVRFGKELSVAAIYACGVWFAPFLGRGVAISTTEIIAFGAFFLAAVLNLFMNSVIEFRLDVKEDLVFGAQVLSRKSIRRIVIVLAFAAALFLGGYLAYLEFTSHSVDIRNIASFAVLALLCLVPGVILVFDTYFSQDHRYRIPAEWVFATGLGLLFLN
jgi:uncharacterized membrane protein YsdA (DUF1294 family)